jgi:glycosyltransferase involved in cell wall biosynthesis
MTLTSIPEERILKRGVFVFAYPLLDDKGALYFADACYQQTIRICRQFLDEVSIVARRRTFQPSLTRIPLDDVHVRLSLELPDFGADGRNNFLNAVSLLFTPKIKESLRRLIQEADFIYVEAPSLEAYLASRVIKQLKRYLVMEMRGDVILNTQYMMHRFGLKGLAYVGLLTILFNSIRHQAQAGLYINHDLMRRYPIVGNHREAISDVRLPDFIFGRPRHYNKPASRFLFVGHLEKVKRLDMILNALHRIRDQLPSGWMFHIVGDGPEMQTLLQITNRLGISSHVNFHGRIQWGDSLFTLYKESDLLLMASTSEGASRTLFEAMAFGLPVVSTSVGAAPELLDGRALVSVGKIQEYASKLIRIVNDIDLLNQISTQNREGAEAFRLSVLEAKRKAFFERAINLSRL